jgi:hypothetical protein
MEEYNNQLPHTPRSFLLRMNTRHCLQMLYSITCCLPASIRHQDHVAALWLSEITRTIIDRYEVGPQKDEVYQKVKNVCSKVFGIHRTHFT